MKKILICASLIALSGADAEAMKFSNPTDRFVRFYYDFSVGDDHLHSDIFLVRSNTLNHEVPLRAMFEEGFHRVAEGKGSLRIHMDSGFGIKHCLIQTINRGKSGKIDGKTVTYHFSQDPKPPHHRIESCSIN